MSDRIIVGISGASGVIYGIRLLQALQGMPGVETHLVMTTAAKQTIAAETDWAIKDVEALAHVVHEVHQIGATIASGSFVTRGMVVIPCSIKTLSGIANSYAADLITRAADVILKEGRPLLLVVRETPLHLGHLRSMMHAAEMGAVIFPPVPAFYGRPQTLDDIIDSTVGRVLARLGFENDLFSPWQGMRSVSRPSTGQAEENTLALEGEEGESAPASVLSGPAKDKIHAFLGSQTTVSLSTVSPDGSPYACDLFYAHRNDSTLYFLSDPKTRHIRNLVRDARVSATIHAVSKGWEDIRGLQLSGQAQRVQDAGERARGYALYLAKYAFVGQWLNSVSALGQFHEHLGVVELYKITPHHLRWLDNSEGFGHKEEWQVPRSE